MVKRQKEKSYPSAREQREHSSHHQFSNTSRNSSVQRRLPFHCCALTLTAYQQPVCTTTNTPSTTTAPTSLKAAVLFENTALVPFVLENGKDPVSGEPLTLRQIITCEMDQDEEGRWQCPILTKPLTDHMKIVAILQRDAANAASDNTNNNNNNLTANVYSYEAYHELNVKAKNYNDLISGLPFHPQKDVILLNDPNNAELEALRDINNFYHIRHGRDLQQQQASANPSTASTKSNVQYSVTATRIMEKLQQQQQQQLKQVKQKKEDEKKRANDNATTNDLTKRNDEWMQKYKDVLSEDVTGVAMTTNQASGSLTSTAMNRTTTTTSSSGSGAKRATREEILQAQFDVMKRLKKKGHVQVQTNLGSFVMELHCDIAPRTCTNFMKLVQLGKYNGTKFHRLIPKFMIQGGKPNTSTTTSTAPKDGKTSAEEEEESSIWGGPFVDEFDDRLKHVGSGICSMANSGPGTNKQQFFITFAPCPHLDRKHSIFGKVIGDDDNNNSGGMSVIQAMERIPTNPKNDRPLQDITIISMQVLGDNNKNNPVQEAEEMELRRLQAKVEARRVEELSRKESALGGPYFGSKRKDATTTTSTTIAATALTNDSQPVETMQVGKYLSKQHQMSNDNSAVGSIEGGSNPHKKTKKTKTTFGDFSNW